ncbi:MAG: methyltransferase domain-containing protein [Candidatus Komeilibacteria bacterium]|nr:methyltransferase domain-containing protein [Candidatus Komeilibacteria bacterium]
MDLFWLTIIIDFFVLVGLLFVIFVLLLPVVLGAPYVTMKPAILEQLIVAAKVLPGERAVDLGSGDGRIVIALARAGAEAHGYEINPILVWLSRRNIRRAGLSGRAFIHGRSFRLVNFSSFNIVTIYGLKSIMKELESKLQKELPKNGRVISHTFQFPSWPPAMRQNGIYLYNKDMLY